MTAPAIELKITGLNELQKVLEEFPRKVARNGIRKSLMAGGHIMEEEMVTLAPEDSGFMKGHFGHRIKLLKGGDVGGRIYIGPEGKIDYPDRDGGYREKTNRKGDTYKVGRISVASVARYFQFGTVKMAPKPFLTQAWESKKEAALNAMVDTLRLEVIAAALQKALGSI